MTRILTCSLLGLALGTRLMAAEDAAPLKTWERSLAAGLNLTQASFDNWAQGGEDAMAWQADLNGTATRHLSKADWEFKGKVSYGETKLGDTDFRKSTDEFSLGTTYTFNRELYVRPYLGGNFRSQLAAGYVYDDATGTKAQNSAAFDPAYLSEAAGVGIEPLKDLKLKLGAAAKQTISSADYMWADDPETANEMETLRSEFGAEAKADYVHAFNDNVSLKSSLVLFSNLGAFSEIDSDWDTSLISKLTSNIQMSLNVRILRDADIDRVRQWKQNLAIGFVYTLL
jgi:hypothetical protein